MAVVAVVTIVQKMEDLAQAMDQVVVEVVLPDLVVQVAPMDTMVELVVLITNNVEVVAVVPQLLDRMVVIVVHLVMEELHLQAQLLDHQC